MQLKLLSRKVLQDIPSASGIELFNNRYYIIGDDSSWLHILDQNFNALENIALLKKEKLSNTAIEKKHKPDFESMTFANIEGEEVLFIFGSGSKPKKRDKLVAIFPAKQHKAQRFSLEELYNVLRKNTIGKNHKLNIEAAAADNEKLYLFHRGNISGRNTVFAFPLSSFAAYVLNDNAELPSYTVAEYALPVLDTIASGFSGASMLDKNRILFSASVENTANEIDDGSVLGSYIGILDLKSKAMKCELLQEEQTTLPLKIESVCLKHSNGNIHTLLAVTDSDGGASELLKLELSE
jgi:hypothetical protein